MLCICGTHSGEAFQAGKFRPESRLSSRMLQRIIRTSVLLLGLWSPLTGAHVPYIEDKDYPEGKDFLITDVDQSKAMYAWLDQGDVDGFELVLDEPGRVYVSTLIPFCREYAYFDVNFALIGPGLPELQGALPDRVEIPDGHGAIVHNADYNSWGARPFMYEMFSDRRYFDGRSYTVRRAEPGTYRFIVWHREGTPGDYVAIVGRSEKFSAEDWALSDVNLRLIQQKKELRSSCEDEGNYAAWFDRDE